MKNKLVCMAAYAAPIAFLMTAAAVPATAVTIGSSIGIDSNLFTSCPGNSDPVCALSGGDQHGAVFIGTPPNLSAGSSAMSALGSASASATAILNYGALGGTAHVEAHGTNIDTVDQFHSGLAFFKIFAKDKITIDSGTLAAGTVVMLHITLMLDSTITASATGTAVGGVQTKVFSGDGESKPLNLNLSIDDSETMDPAMRTLTFDAMAQVGDIIDIVHELTISAAAQVSLHNGPDAVVDIDADQTSHFYIDVMTTGAFITSDSGHNYALTTNGPPTGVPAPGGLGLFLFGLAGLRFLHRKRPA